MRIETDELSSFFMQLDEGGITSKMLGWYNSLTPEYREELMTASQPFTSVYESSFTVPSWYKHETCIAWAKESGFKFDFHNSMVSDEIFADANPLAPGKTYRLKFFRPNMQNYLSDLALAFIENQPGVLLAGPQGLIAAWPAISNGMEHLGNHDFSETALTSFSSENLRLYRQKAIMDLRNAVCYAFPKWQKLYFNGFGDVNWSDNNYLLCICE